MTTPEVSTAPTIQRHLERKTSAIKTYYLKDEIPELVKAVRDMARTYLDEAMSGKDEYARADHTATLLKACAVIPMGKYVKWKDFEKSLGFVVTNWAQTL